MGFHLLLQQSEYDLRKERDILRGARFSSILLSLRKAHPCRCRSRKSAEQEQAGT
jgi:hypothetical protein